MRRITLLLLAMFMVLGLTSCEENTDWKISDTRHQLDDTTIYNATNFYEGIDSEITYDEYVSLATERYGADALEFQQSPSYTDKDLPPVEGYTWKAVHTRLYDETKDINSYVTAGFLNDELRWMQTGSLVYAESDSDFKDKAEVLIEQNNHMYDGMENQSFSGDKWSGRNYVEVKDGDFGMGFSITIALPGNVVETEYKTEPYEQGKVGVILFDYITYYTEPYPESGILDNIDYTQFLNFRR